MAIHNGRKGWENFENAEGQYPGLERICHPKDLLDVSSLTQEVSDLQIALIPT